MINKKKIAIFAKNIQKSNGSNLEWPRRIDWRHGGRRR